MDMRTAAVVLVAALCARAEEPPLAPGVTVELRSERTEFAIGDPVLLDVVYRNEGEGTWIVDEDLMPVFHDVFDVRDVEATKVPNAFALSTTYSDGGLGERHKLKPGTTVTLRKYVNESAAFEKPGEYVVKARGEVYSVREDALRNSRLPPLTGPLCRCESRPLKIRILPARGKWERISTASSLKALWRAPKLREREDYAQFRPYVTDANGRTDALRLLAFRRDQDLLPFWLERLDDKSKDARNDAFVPEALAGLPDRAAVLKALEERLERGERERVLRLYTCLAVPKTDDLEWKDVFARRREIRERYK